MKNQNTNQHLLEQLFQTLEELRAEIREFARPAEEQLLDDVQLCELLHVSKRTVATWRQKGLIKHSWLLGKCYYKYSDVLAAIEANAISPMKNQLKIKL
ncbi:MAG: DNA-binding protein [Flavobacterium sp.]|nr:MAG: DNA-binding protein [Flavobacterium sp.]